MSRQEKIMVFRSELAPVLGKFINEKRATGYKYARESEAIVNLDRFLVIIGHKERTLPKEVVEEWIRKRPGEKPRTQSSRINTIRQVGDFLLRHGYHAHIPDSKIVSVVNSDFAPYIFTHGEIRRLIKSADGLKPQGQSPKRHLMIPLIIRLLYCCGLRLREALDLRIEDFDPEQGVLTIRKGKFRRDRFVPLPQSLCRRMRNYVRTKGNSEMLFPAPDGEPYTNRALYGIFRELLRMSNIPHGGRGKGPRLHDLRHTYAAHRLHAWCKEGANLKAVIRVLSDYMGHSTLAGTSRYLHLTAEVYPDLVARMQADYGHIIPRGDRNETD